MANIVWLEPGTSATFDTSFFTGSGTFASASDQTHGQPRSLKLSTGSPATTANADRTAILADAGRRISFYFRFDAAPSNDSAFLALRTSGGSTVFLLNLTSARKLKATPTGVTSVTGTAVLSTNTWYRISVGYHITNTTTFVFNVYVDGGAADVTVNSGTMTTTGTDALRFAASTPLGANQNEWVSDIYVDDGSDDSDPGDIRVTAKRPNANGATNSFDTTTSTTNSGYGTGNSIYVNERALATTGARRHNANNSTATENFAIENAATGDVDLTGLSVYGYMTWVQASGVSTDKIWDNGSTFAPSPSNFGTAAVKWHATTTTTYPSNSATCGMDRPSNSSTDAILNECGVIFAYNPVPSFLAAKPVVIPQAIVRSSVY